MYRTQIWQVNNIFSDSIQKQQYAYLFFYISRNSMTEKKNTIE